MCIEEAACVIMGDDICNDFILVKNFGECMDNNNSFAEILTVTKFIIVGVV